MNIATAPVPPTLSVQEHVISVGFDACDIDAWERCLEEGGTPLLRRTYRPVELAECRGRADRLSTRFAAKEAVAKALGTGFCEGVTFLDVEIVTEPSGRPAVQLHDGAAERALDGGIHDVHVSLAHEAGVAYAYVVAAGPAGES